MPRLSWVTISLGGLLMMAGCTSGNFTPGNPHIIPPLTKGAKPQPQEDFQRLRELFIQHGGDLLTLEDKVVQWKDTS